MATCGTSEGKALAIGRCLETVEAIDEVLFSGGDPIYTTERLDNSLETHVWKSLFLPKMLDHFLAITVPSADGWRRLCLRYANASFAKIATVFFEKEPLFFPLNATLATPQFVVFKGYVFDELLRGNFKRWAEMNAVDRRNKCAFVISVCLQSVALRAKIPHFMDLFGCVQEMMTSSAFAESTGSKIGQTFSSSKAQMNHDKLAKKVFVQMGVPRSGNERLKYVGKVAEKSKSMPVFAQRKKTKSTRKVISRLNKDWETSTSIPFDD